MEKKKITKKSKIILSIVLVVLVAAIAVLGIFLYKFKFAGNGAANPFSNRGEMNMEGMNFSEMVAAYGVINIGMVTEEFPIEEFTTELEVEEVLVSSGQEITDKTPIVKFSIESVEALKEELEKTLRAADLEYRSGKIEYEQSVINAKYEYEQAVLSGKSAQAVYNETIATMEDSVKKAKEAYEEAKTEIAEIEASIANNTYQTTVDAYQKEYDENLELLKKYMEEWGIGWSEVTGMGGGQGASRDYVNILKGIYSILEHDRELLDEAELELEEYSLNLQTLKLSLPELESSYASAQASYESSLVQAELTKQTSLTEAELAEKNYKTKLEKAESDFEALEEAKETAEENLQVFHTQIVDGYYYPTETGTLMRVSVRAGRSLSAGGSMFMLQDSEKMTVTVSVDQNDISKLSVGGTAMVMSEDSGTSEGVITSINPVSQSSAISSVTYNVTVELDGRKTGFSNNETVTVYFIIGGSNEEKA